jgi:hypothetical protein
MSKTEGLTASARANATLCFMPPLDWILALESDQVDQFHVSPHNRPTLILRRASSLQSLLDVSFHRQSREVRVALE